MFMEIFFNLKECFLTFCTNFNVFVGFCYNQIFKLLDLCTANIPAKTKEKLWQQNMKISKRNLGKKKGGRKTPQHFSPFFVFFFLLEKMKTKTIFS